MMYEGTKTIKYTNTISGTIALWPDVAMATVLGGPLDIGRCKWYAYPITDQR